MLRAILKWLEMCWEYRPRRMYCIGWKEDTPPGEICRNRVWQAGLDILALELGATGPFCSEECAVNWVPF